MMGLKGLRMSTLRWEPETTNAMTCFMRSRGVVACAAFVRKMGPVLQMSQIRSMADRFSKIRTGSETETTLRPSIKVLPAHLTTSTRIPRWFDKICASLHQR